MIKYYNESNSRWKEGKTHNPRAKPIVVRKQPVRRNLKQLITLGFKVPMWAAAQFLFSIYAAPEPNQGTVAPKIGISPPSKYKTKVIPHSHAQRSVSQVILDSAKFDNTNHHGYE